MWHSLGLVCQLAGARLGLPSRYVARSGHTLPVAKDLTHLRTSLVPGSRALQIFPCHLPVELQWASSAAGQHVGTDRGCLASTSSLCQAQRGKWKGDSQHYNCLGDPSWLGVEVCPLFLQGKAAHHTVLCIFSYCNRFPM